MIAIVLTLTMLAAGPAQPDGGACFSEQTRQAMNESSVLNDRRRAAALADAGLELILVEREETDCQQQRDKRAPGTLVVQGSRRFIVAGPSELQTRRSASDVSVAKDAKGVLHLVEFEAEDVVTPVALTRCTACPSRPCWSSGIPPCATQPLLGPLPAQAVGKPVRLRWQREVLRFQEVPQACPPAGPCPAIP